MPQSSSKERPPEPMTWSRASLILVLAVLFDALRAFFQFFWFFGPALATLYCAIKTSSFLSTWTLGLLGTKTAAAICGTAGFAAGSAFLVATASIGTILAEAVGLIGFLTLGLLLIMTNSRMFASAKQAPWYFAGAFITGEIPFLGALPLFSVTLWRLYSAQIKAETAAFAAWEKQHAEELAQERQRKAAELMRLQQAQAAQAEEKEAANDAAFEEESEEAADLEQIRHVRALQKEQAEHAGEGQRTLSRLQGIEAADDESYRQRANG